MLNFVNRAMDYANIRVCKSKVTPPRKLYRTFKNTQKSATRIELNIVREDWLELCSEGEHASESSRDVVVNLTISNNE